MTNTPWVRESGPPEEPVDSRTCLQPPSRQVHTQAGLAATTCLLAHALAPFRGAMQGWASTFRGAQTLDTEWRFERAQGGARAGR
jgi:hypothetical protein